MKRIRNLYEKDQELYDKDQELQGSENISIWFYSENKLEIQGNKCLVSTREKTQITELSRTLVVQ